MRWSRIALLVVAASLVVVVACTQPVDDPAISLTLMDRGFPIPEQTVSEGIWRDLPATCDGIAEEGNLETAFAENAPALGVLMLEGEPVCVDTWNGIRIELERVLGDPSPDPMHPLMHIRVPEHVR